MDLCQQHDFCHDCLMQWVMTKNTCPSCNVPIKYITMPQESEMNFFTN